MSSRPRANASARSRSALAIRVLFPCLARTIDHCHDRADLPAFLRRVTAAGIAPPVPAATRVVDPPVARDCLRVEHDQPIRVRPTVVAGVAHEGCAGSAHDTLTFALDALAAAVERDMDA